mmetsp:Transcript_17984/g.27847  ORF Transcript_17984/g.27847 Transcript_17984/m.27847 type:complete len:113 (+) Transcript_17984:177-515(+)
MLAPFCIVCPAAYLSFFSVLSLRDPLQQQDMQMMHKRLMGCITAFKMVRASHGCGNPEDAMRVKAPMPKYMEAMVQNVCPCRQGHLLAMPSWNDIMKGVSIESSGIELMSPF